MWSPERPPVHPAIWVASGVEMSISGGTATRETDVSGEARQANTGPRGLRRWFIAKARDAINERATGFTMGRRGRRAREG
jgi:hypothetical protein